jgi:DNA modification methylase
MREETIGNCRLILGDCREILPSLPLCDAVITDPPYMFTTASAGAGKLSPWADMCNAAFWFAEILKLCRGRLRYGTGFVWWFLSWRSLPTVQKAAFDIGWNIESLLVWDKQWIGPGGQRGLRPSYELVALFCDGEAALPNRGLPDIWQHKWSSDKPNGHPAEKPISLVERLVKETPAGHIVDPFLGSGTAAVACLRQGRTFTGIELDPQHFDNACRRIEAAHGQADLFRAPPPKPVQVNLLDGAA